MATGAAPLRAPTLTAKIDDETLGVPVNCSAYPYVSIWVTGNGTTSSGVITIEEAEWDPLHDQPFSSTWAPITTVNASDVSGGVQKSVHLPVASYAFIRARISTVIGGGGSVTVIVRGTGS